MIDPAGLMMKAEQALATGKVALDLGDANNAAGRAYYAMFNAARAAPNATTGDDPGRMKTHSGALAVAFEDRAIADYDGQSVVPGDAARDLEAASRFVAVCRRLVDACRRP